MYLGCNIINRRFMTIKNEKYIKVKNNRRYISRLENEASK